MKRRKLKKKAAMVQVTSLCDIMTILLIFVMVQLVSDNQLLSKSADIILPFTNDTTSFSAPDLLIAISPTYIVLDNKPVAKMSDVMESYDALIEPLRAILEVKRTQTEALMQAIGREFEGRVVIQAHKDIEYKALYKVLYTCGLVGYNNMALIAMQRGKKVIY